MPLTLPSPSLPFRGEACTGALSYHHPCAEALSLSRAAFDPLCLSFPPPPSLQQQQAEADQAAWDTHEAIMAQYEALLLAQVRLGGGRVKF